jgi:hypothetical protein
MMETPSRNCPQCGAQLSPDWSQCWLCGAKRPSLGAGEAAARVAGMRRGAGGSAAAPPYGLSSVVLVVTLLAILCSIIGMNPGLGIPISVLAVPALLRTVFVVLRREESGEPMSAGGKMASFLLSMVIVAMVAVAAVVAAAVAFLATCIAAGAGAGRIGHPQLPFIIGGVAAVVAAILTAGAIWSALRRMRM